MMTSGGETGRFRFAKTCGIRTANAGEGTADCRGLNVHMPNWSST